jgi:hypothetical protein
MCASLLPPPNFSFAPYNFAVSPDGTRLAFVAVGPDGKDTLWVRALYVPGAQQLNGTEWAAFPFWSPDSRRIGFFAEGKLKTVDIAGGAVEILCQAPVGNGGTWSRDGTIVFAPTIAGPLYRVSANGGVPAPVTRLARQRSGQAHRWPFFLPDGKHFLYDVDWSAPEGKQGKRHLRGLARLGGTEADLLRTLGERRVCLRESALRPRSQPDGPTVQRRPAGDDRPYRSDRSTGTGEGDQFLAVGVLGFPERGVSVPVRG